MAKDLTILLEDRPAQLALLGETLGNENINMEAACGFNIGVKGEIHILVEDAEGAKKALEKAGIPIKGERDVLVLGITNRPGEFGKLARQIAEADVNIDLFYLTASNQIVFGVDNIDRARAAL
jgi:hypothetical protein